MKYIAVLSLLVFCIFQKTYGQHEVTWLTEEDGLTSNVATCVYKDHLGFIWIGTSYGLNVYTGKHFHHYKSDITDPHSLSDNQIFYISEDADSNLWVSTNIGLNRYVREKDHFKRYYTDTNDSSTISHNETRYHLTSRNGHFWFTSRDGLNKLIKSPKGDFTFKRYYFNSGKPGSKQKSKLSLFNLIEGDSGIIWLASWGKGLIKFNPEQDKFNFYMHRPSSDNGLPSNLLKSITRDRDGFIWIGSNKGFAILDPKTNTFKNDKNTPALNMSLRGIGDVNTLMCDNSGNMWVGRYSSLRIVNTKTFDLQNHVMNVAGEKMALINHIYQDNTGIVWVASGEEAIAKYDPNVDKFKEHYVTLKNKGEKDHIKSFAIDSNNNIWLATFENGLLKTDRAGNIMKRIANPNIRTRYIHHIVIDKQQRLWIGGLQGIEMFSLLDNTNTKTFIQEDKKAAKLEHNVIYKLVIDSRNWLWILTQEGVNYMNLNEEDLVVEDIPFDHNLLKNLDVYVDNNDDIVICGEGGAIFYSPEQGETHTLYYSPNNINGLSNYNVNCVVQDDEGYYWFGTNNGLNRYNKKTGEINTWYEKDGLGSALIYDIESFEKGIWIKTSKGLSQLTRKSGDIKNYTTVNGVPPKGSCLWKSGKEELYVSGESGYAFFKPAEIRDNKFVPKVYFTGFRANGQDVPIGDKSILKKHITCTRHITLHHDIRTLQFNFAALNYTLPRSNQYKYQLEGYDTAWHFLGNENKIILMNLAAGKYTLKVHGSNNDKVWSTKPAVMNITMLPPWWRTWQASSLTAIFLGLIVFFFRFFTQKKERLIAEMKKQKEINQMKFRFYTDMSHEIRTPLTLIQGPLKRILGFPNLHDSVRDNVRVIEKNTERLLQMVNNVLDIRKLELYGMELRPSDFDIISFTQQYITSLEGKEFELRFYANVKTLLVHMDMDAFDKILSNLLSNAVKYSPENGKIEVFINYEENCSGHRNKQAGTITIEVKDNGPGIPDEEKENIFNRFYRVKGRPDQTHKGFGIGLHLVKEAVNALEGEISVVSNAPSGCVFTVELPVEQKGLENIHHEQKINIDLGMPTLPNIFDNVKGADNKLLVVEDHKDLRNYIASVFSEEKIEIITARDGKEGVEKAREYIPDIIITDIMMPVMNGMELVHSLKNDNLTDHIPVIMLTAKSLVEDQVDGLKTGADDYLVKPFEESILKAKVSTLLKNREILQNKFRAGIVTWEKDKKEVGDLPEIQDNDGNKLFLDRAKEIIEKSYSSEDFNTQSLADELLITRRHLTRKFSGLTGMLPSDYIRDFRLQKAYDILQKNREITINELAYQNGFKSASHFSRVYKEKFGNRPSDFKR
jgi:signal transduction histidine kinase/ligand-binding sensor domain-containing protein/DNA-binding NarL/FixJ family response regulator